MSIAEYLAIYAACLSTVVFLWNIARATPRFKVKIVSGSDEIDGEFMIGAYISVQNPSPHTIHLSGIDLLYPIEDRNLADFAKHIIKYRRLSRTVGWVFTNLSYFGIKDGCPIALEPNQSHSIFIPHNVIEDVLKNGHRRELRAVAHDQLWRRKYSNKFVIPKFILNNNKRST